MDDDFWNIDGARDLSDSWTGFTRFTLLEENPPDVYTWSGVRLTKKQTTSRPDGLWPENMSEAAQRKEKHKWAIEKPKLDNARRLRGIYFTDPAGEEFTETIENAQKKVGSSDASGNALQDRERKVQGILSHFQCSKGKICLHC